MKKFIQNIKNLNCLNCLMQIFKGLVTYVGLASNSILSRLCLVSLILMTIGVGEMWGSCWTVTKAELTTDQTYKGGYRNRTTYYYYSSPQQQIATVSNPYSSVSSINFTVTGDTEYGNGKAQQKFKVMYKKAGDANWTIINTEYTLSCSRSWTGGAITGHYVYTAGSQSITISNITDIVEVGINCTNYNSNSSGYEGKSRTLTISNFSVTFSNHFASAANGTTLTAFPSTEVNTTCATTRTFSFSYNSGVSSYTWTSSNNDEFPLSGNYSYASSCGASKTITVSFTPKSIGDNLESTITGTDNHNNTITVKVTGSSWGKANPIYTYNDEYWNANGVQIKDVYVDDEITDVFGSTSNANPTYSITKISDSGTNNGDAVTSFVSNHLVAGRAGTYRLGISQQAISTTATSGYNAGSDELLLTVKKRPTSLVGSVSPMLVDATPTINGYSVSNTSDTNPSEGDSNDFYYTVTNTSLHQPTVVTGCAEGHEGDVIGYTPGTHTITAYNAGTAKLTICQKETYKYTGATMELDVTVSKHEPEFTWNSGNKKYHYQSEIANIFSSTNATTDTTVISSNPYSSVVIDNTLHIYNVEEPSEYTLRQAENYYWSFKEEKVTVTPVEQNNHVEFTISNSNHTNFENVSSFSTAATWQDPSYRLGDGGWGTQDDYVIIQFEGIPDSLFFDKTLGKSVNQLPGTHLCQVYQSADGSSWSDPIWSHDEREEHKMNNRVGLLPTTRYIKFAYHGTVYCYYKNIKVTELNKFYAGNKESNEDNEINFGTQGEKYGTQVKTINFNHANAGRTTTTNIEGADARYFTVAPEAIPGTGRDLSGMTTCRVAFNNKNESRTTEYRAELVISDNLGHEERVTLRGIRTGNCKPEYTWNPNHMPYYYNSTIAHVAVSTNTDYTNCPMTYETSNKNIAEVTADGMLHIYEIGQPVTITVKQTTGNTDYDPGSATFTFTPRERPNLAVPFQVNNAIYNESIEKGKKCYWENDEGGRIRSGNTNILIDDWIWESEEKIFTLSFKDHPDKLSFEYRNNNMGSLINSTPSPSGYHMWEVFESADGATWTSLWHRDSQHKEWTEVKDLQLAETTQFIKFVYWGNYEGYWRNINVSSLDGYKFLREETNDQYLSRGSNYGTRAIVDAFGIATRVTRFTPDNETYYAQFQFVDNVNFLFEDYKNEIYTDYWADDEGKNTKVWKVTINNDLWTLQSTSPDSNGKYITLTNGVLALTNYALDATKWYLENYAQHTDNITKMLDEQAVAAASHSDLDFPNVTTLAGVRHELSEHGYEFTDIDLPAHGAEEQVWSTNVRKDGEAADPVYENVVTDLVPGFYHLKIKAFIRVASAEVAYSVFNRGVESVATYAYANEVKYPIKSIFDETGRSGVQFTQGTDLQYPNGSYYANDLTAADLAFANANGYVNDVYVYVPADAGKTTGTLRYGIMSSSYVPDAWMVYGGITLRHLDRAQYIFEGSEESEDKEDWGEETNWDRGDKPGKDNAVIIRSDVTITEEVVAYSVTIEDKVNVTIAPTGGLTVGKGGIKGATKENFFLKADTASKSETRGQTGFLRISPECEEEMPEVTIELLRQGYTNGNVTAGTFSMSGSSSWQYVGCPVEKDKLVKRVVGGWINSWDEDSGSWINSRANLMVTPFEGFANSQSDDPNGALNPFKGKLYDNTVDYNVTLTCGKSEMAGWNLLANSFAAPIDIQALLADKDEKDIDKAIYIFNTGNTQQAVKDGAGTYTTITNATIEARQTQGVIPAMQGFFVKALKECQFTFNYANIVWAATYEGETENTPMRVKRNSTKSEKQVVSVLLEANGQRDKLLLIESEDYSTNYENGYDAHTMPVGACNIFAVEGDDYLTVDATNSIIGTRIGVRTGEETAYTITFNQVDNEGLALQDSETDETIDISEGTEYTFSAEPNSEITNRFQIVGRAQAPTNPTGIEGTEAGAKVHKFIKDNQVYILKNGVLYDMMGAIVR